MFFWAGFGFDTSVPTVWLLEGLLMYLSLPDTHDLMGQMGRLSAPGSAVFHDACSKRYINAGIVVGGAPFIGGSDEYGILWATHTVPRGTRHLHPRTLLTCGVCPNVCGGTGMPSCGRRTEGLIRASCATSGQCRWIGRSGRSPSTRVCPRRPSRRAAGATSCSLSRRSRAAERVPKCRTDALL